MTAHEHTQDQDPKHARCPLGARSAQACGGPSGPDAAPLVGWVTACGGTEDSLPGCATHLGEVLVIWDPGEWIGISSDGTTDDTAAVATRAERIAAEITDGRHILGIDGPGEDLPRPASADELARAVRYADADT